MVLNIGLIGPTGFGGSHLAVELLRRGHVVRGISRHPEKLGTHDNYSTFAIDIEACSLEQLIESFRGVHVLINEFGPHTAGEHALRYEPIVELTRKIIIAVKESKVPYFINIGGCGSLHLPGTRLYTCSESKLFWLNYRRGIADSDAHVAYMEERLGSLGTDLRRFRDARIKVRSGDATEADFYLIQSYEASVLKSDKALAFVTAARTCYMFFEGNTSFRWTFVSPPALYRSGKRTGSYNTIYDEIPLKSGKDGQEDGDLEGRLHGISAADLAIAIADEAENQKHTGRHWSAYADMSHDVPAPSYITL